MHPLRAHNGPDDTVDTEAQCLQSWSLCVQTAHALEKQSSALQTGLVPGSASLI